jgi:hypothetical protein
VTRRTFVSFSTTPAPRPGRTVAKLRMSIRMALRGLFIGNDIIFLSTILDGFPQEIFPGGPSRHVTKPGRI